MKTESNSRQVDPIIYQKIETIRKHLQLYLKGNDEVIDYSIATLLAGGHLLLEGPPGIGKTSLCRGLATLFGGTFKRIQMTSDLLPSDVTGILRLKADQSGFEFRRGPIFSNFLLADELNRTSPKTQSALLEAMAERTVTVDGDTYHLPDPFFVLATQNPSEFHGVYQLAESQLDRFMMLITVEVPVKAEEFKIYSHFNQFQNDIESKQEKSPDTHMPIQEIHLLKKAAFAVYMDETILNYCLDIVSETRSFPGINHGVSVRGGLQLIAASKTIALVKGRNFVLPDDVRHVAVPTLAHRLLSTELELNRVKRAQIITDILGKVPLPK